MGNTTRLPSWVFSFAQNDENDESDEGEVVEVPEDLSGIDDETLETLESELLATFDAVRTNDSLTPADLEELRTITAGVDRLRAERTQRTEERERLTAEAAALAAQVHDSDESDSDDEDDGGAGEPEGDSDDTAEETAENEPEPVTAASSPGTLAIKKRGLNVPLSEVRRHAPDPGIEAAEATIVVAPDVPAYPAGRRLDTLETLGDAVHRRAKTLANPSGSVTVATIKRDYDIILDREAAPERIWEVMHRAANPKALVAAGGWCAPSNIIYDFFNVVCEDGILDVPTVGVQRGGIRWPVSPDISQVLDDVWLWTEADDIAATGGSPTKPCVRVPCPTFNEERLECHGICVTAGNLMDSAYPELIRNFLRLLMAAHRHVINRRIIDNIVALSTAVTGAPVGAGTSVTTDLLDMIGLQVADYRDRFRMCATDVLEVVLPRWAKEAIRADIARRTGVDMLAVTDAQIMQWFDLRSVRVQFVADWQVGAGDLPGQTTPLTAWPANVQFLIYAAGTFVVGNGLDLDLGVVRDSTLNATNDFTAAWTEECNLVAQIGHQGRLVTVPVCVAGETGAADITCGNVGP